MRFDHILIHADNDPQQIRLLKEQITPLGYPFHVGRNWRSFDLSIHNINIGSQYIEIVRLNHPNAKSWMPLWTRYYNEGRRGAYCIFLEVENLEQAVLEIHKAGMRARGPVVLSYPALLGLARMELPYSLYFLPYFPDSHLQLALMQYKKASVREAFHSRLVPNAIENGIQGIRQVTVELPNLPESAGMLQKIFSSHLSQGEGGWVIQMDKTRLIFRASPDHNTRVRLTTVCTMREWLGGKFQIHNVEVITSGG